jgi:hypothetical protein
MDCFRLQVATGIALKIFARDGVSRDSFPCLGWHQLCAQVHTCSSSVNCTVLYRTFFQYGYLDTIGTYRWFSGFRIEEARLRRVPAPCASIAHEERADGAVLCPDGVVIVNRP